MKRTKPTITKNAGELSKVLGLTPSHAYQWELRSELVSKLGQIVQKSRLTHAEVAQKAKTSRTRITAILNRNIDDVSTDLLLRILEALGYRVNISITRSIMAA